MARRLAGEKLIALEASSVAFNGANFELAYRAHTPLLLTVAYHVLRDREAAQDAVQSALMRAWSNGTYRAERGPLVSYLVACVRRESLDIVRGRQRREARERRVADEPIVPDPTAAIDPVEARRVAAALERLPAPQRDVIVRVYYGGSTLAETADHLGVPIGTIKSRLSEALRRLGSDLSRGIT